MADPAAALDAGGLGAVSRGAEPTILVERDGSCRMARVSLAGERLAEGN